MADRTRREFWESLPFILPLVLWVAVFILVPVLATLVNSLFLDVSFLPIRWLGPENYRRLLEDPGFWQALRFTVLFALVSVPLELAIGFALALVLNEPLPLRGWLRAVVLIPWAIPAAVSGRVFQLIYNYHYGLANALIRQLGLSAEPVNWLGSEPGAFFALVAADAWKTAPFVAIILLAGLAAIPGELYRQARVDGAGLVQRWRHLTVPLLRPVLVVALLFRSVDALRVFDMVYVITGGGPGGATNSLSLYGYDFFLAGDFGYGSAVSVVLFAIALLLSVIYLKAGRFAKELR